MLFRSKMGVQVMFNPGVKELENAAELMKLFKYVDVLNVNKSEAARIVPGTVLTELLYHLSAMVPTAIITDGAMGGIEVTEANCTDLASMEMYA